MELSNLVTGLGNTGFTIAVFIIALSVIVTVHEYGHYIVGRWCGIRADVFSLGFGKPLIQRRDKRGTVWQIAALPLGGYVKFAGDANAASMPKTAGDEAPRDTLIGAPIWARSLTVAAGPIFNFILSALIFTVMFAAQGQPTEKVFVEAVKPTPYAVALEAGDQVLSVDDVLIDDVASLYGQLGDIAADEQLSYEVLRDGAVIRVDAAHPFPVIISGLSPKSAAIDAGLEIGDVITHAGGEAIHAFSALQDMVMASEGASIDLTIWRAGEVSQTTLTPRPRDIPTEDGGFEKRWLIGITGGLLFELATERVGLGDAITGGIKQVGEIIKTSLEGLWAMVTGVISVCNLSGPVGIAETTSVMASQGTVSFIWIIAVLSTAIGMLNLFPIPMLDGGHLVFYAYEAVRGKPLPPRVLNVMMMIGVVSVGFLMILGLSSDLFCV